MYWYWHDFSQWMEDFNVGNKIFRFWHKTWPEDMSCSFVYITQVIQLPNNELLIGTQDYDESYPDCRYPSISYNLLSEITIEYYARDQEDEEE